MKSILITGGNGNIAKMIRNNLGAEFNITCITRNDFDLLDYKSIETYLSDKTFDVLIHTAITGGRRTKDETGEVVYKNLIMFENLCIFADKFNLIINFDSGAIYDRATNIYCRKEDELQTVPTDYYGFSKYLMYKRSLQYAHIVNFRIFNIFHPNEEPDRFIKACFLAKQSGNPVTIFHDKYFDFMYEDDFIKIIRFYIEKWSINVLPKTFNLSYSEKYKLSDIAALILVDKDKIIIKDSDCLYNYCGNSDLLTTLNIKLDGLESGLEKMESKC
jgi:UDP-glucose 4-epimerase